MKTYTPELVDVADLSPEAATSTGDNGKAHIESLPYSPSSRIMKVGHCVPQRSGEVE